jgi:ABC-type sugar transport system substrate-binding protein
MKSKSGFCVLGGLVAVLLLAAGCGSDTEAAGAPQSDATSAADPGVARAKAVVDRLSELPKSIGITEPVQGTIPAGKRIVYVPLNVPAATENIKFLKAAADELDWEVEMVSGGLAPEEFKAALAQVLKDRPDGVFTAGIPAAVVTQELQGFADATIPVVMLGTGLDGVVDPPVLANIYAHAPQEESGTYNADWVIADSGGAAHIVYYDFTAVETVAAVGKGFARTIAADCPKCTIENVDVNGADIGTNLPGQIVGYLRAHPETNYVALAFSDLAIGVPGALADAGISPDKVRIVGANPGPGNRVNIAAGNYEQAAVSFPKYENMWRVIDIFARHFTGDDIAPSVDAPYPYFMFTADNVKAWGGKPEDEWAIVPDYREQYLALWGR